MWLWIWPLAPEKMKQNKTFCSMYEEQMKEFERKIFLNIYTHTHKYVYVFKMTKRNNKARACPFVSTKKP